MRATVDIADLSAFGLGVASNGGGTNGEQEELPSMSLSAGDDILLARSPSAMEAYFGDCFYEFEHVLTASSSISQNGDDAIELFEHGSVIETFGDIDTDGTGEAWEYLDSWTYKIDGEWSYGGVNCTDGAGTNAAADCPYPICISSSHIFGCTEPSANNYNADATIDDGSCTFTLTNGLSLQGIIDFTVPSGGSDGKALHVKATADISDLSIYGIGVANNGDGSDGQEYTFDSISVATGDDILIVRSDSVLGAYFGDCYDEFEHVLIGSSDIAQKWR